MTEQSHFNPHLPPNEQLVVQKEQSHLPSTYVRETMPYFDEGEVHLRDYIDVVFRRKWVVIITLLVVFSFVAIQNPVVSGKGDDQGFP
jgi:hypothetical protein